MMWLIFALVMAFAVAEAILIERLWRDQRQTRQEFDELYDQVDALAVAVDRQVLTQEQMQDQIKPAVDAIRESNQVVVETMDALVGTIREAKSERRKLRDLIANNAQDIATVEDADELPVTAPAPAAAQSSEPAPISWPDTNGRLDVTAAARQSGRSRSEVALAHRLGRTMPAKKRATG